MKRIPLSQGKFALVDDEDFERLSQHRWHVTPFGYAQRTYRKNGKKCHVWMHRVILGLKDGEYTDHINGDRLDNRQNNLRRCNYKENQRNRGKVMTRRGRPTTSRHKGVGWHKESGRWRSYITIKNKYLQIGLFQDETEAAIYYNVAAQLFFGEFARLNVIE